MKKEVQVYISDDCVQDIRDYGRCTGNSISSTKNISLKNKATLIVEVAEKKYEITEAQFDKVWEKFLWNNSCKDALKKELFK